MEEEIGLSELWHKTRRASDSESQGARQMLNISEYV